MRAINIALNFIGEESLYFLPSILKHKKAIKEIVEYPNKENNIQIDCMKYGLKPILEILEKKEC